MSNYNIKCWKFQDTLQNFLQISIFHENDDSCRQRVHCLQTHLATEVELPATVMPASTIAQTTVKILLYGEVPCRTDNKCTVSGWELCYVPEPFIADTPLYLSCRGGDRYIRSKLSPQTRLRNVNTNNQTFHLVSTSDRKRLMRTAYV